MCIDFRELNKKVKVNQFPLPKISEALEQLEGATIFSKLDLKCGCWQMPVRESDKEKFAFSTSSGHYQFSKMPFGYGGAPAEFQAAMTSTIGELLHHICILYMDDVLIYSKTWGEHKTHLMAVF